MLVSVPSINEGKELNYASTRPIIRQMKKNKIVSLAVIIEVNFLGQLLFVSARGYFRADRKRKY